MIRTMTAATGGKIGRPSKGPRIRLSGMVPHRVHATAERKAASMGMTITDYLEYLVVRDNEANPLLTSSTEVQGGLPFADVA